MGDRIRSHTGHCTKNHRCKSSDEQTAQRLGRRIAFSLGSAIYFSCTTALGTNKLNGWFITVWRRFCNQSLHSFLIVHLAREEGASMDVGFYYMANAMGRLLGTVLSGWAYQWGLTSCLWISSLFILKAYSSHC